MTDRPSAPILAGATRREAFAAAALLAGAGAVAASPASAQSASEHLEPGDGVVSTPDDAVVRTTAGAVRGFKRSGVYTFKGIPYGADTGGSARFMPPRPADKWSGVRLSLVYGPISPQAQNPHAPGQAEQPLAFVNDIIPGQIGEDCLCLNVWSRGLDPAAKRPVMVWLHGGGFFSGSSSEEPSYNGENLARKGVVLVSVNHRLGPVGFMDMTGVGGAAFRGSGNAGMLDLVLALEWVRDNIAGFGGDPSRVTIFGHSGGGGKVSTLMSMPSAKGLFHRAGIMSGSFPAGIPQKDAQALTAATMAQLGLAPGDIAGLQQVDAARLIAAGNMAARKLAPPPAAGGLPRSGGINFGPVIDGDALPEDWHTAAPRQTADVPMIIGNVRDEFRPTSLSFTDADLSKAVPPQHADKAPQIIAALRKAYPGLPPTEIGAMIGGMFMRNMALDQCRKKQALGAAPVYSYWFTWASPILDGRIGVPHGSDIPGAFDNTANSDQFTGNTPEARRLAKVMSQAWINFATTGNPSQPDHAWPAWDPNVFQTMIFDNRVRVEDDPAGEARRLLV